MPAELPEALAAFIKNSGTTLHCEDGDLLKRAAAFRQPDLLNLRERKEVEKILNSAK